MTKEQLEKLDAMAKPRSEEAIAKAEERKKRWMNMMSMKMDEKKIDWEQRRYEIAKEMLPCVARIRSNASENGEVSITVCVNDAVMCADMLIDELKSRECKQTINY